MSIDTVILDPLENAFDSIGAMQGEAAPLKRAAIGAAIGYAVVMGLKPKIAWDEKNKTWKKFAGTATEAEKDKSTWFPVWAFVAVPAAIFSLLI